MQPFTYDPIMESHILSRFRLLKPLRPPAPGTALVLVPHNGTPLVIRHGEPIIDARYGTYQRSYLVNVGEHRLMLEIPLLSNDAAFGFRSLIRLNCRVVAPDEIVHRRIRDVSAALYPAIQQMLRKVSRNFDISEFHIAEDALNDSIRIFTGDSAIRLRNISVELLVDEDEIHTSGRAYRDIERDTRLMAMRRNRHLKMLRADGMEGLIAEIMEREGPRAAHELITAAEGAERTELLRAWEAVLKHSDADRESWELLQAERALRDRLVGDSAAPFGGTRSSRLRSSLAASEAHPRAGRIGTGEDRMGASAGEPDAGAAREPTPAAHREDPKAENRVRPAAAPPDEEPVGGTHFHERKGERRPSRVRGIPLPRTEYPDERPDGGQG
ncbi:ferritin family protein [Streptosporangium soli]|nr:hypothetical protein [Streptosporangium sp. KLBMP 9127]